MFAKLSTASAVVLALGAMPVRGIGAPAAGWDEVAYPDAHAPAIVVHESAGGPERPGLDEALLEPTAQPEASTAAPEVADAGTFVADLAAPELPGFDDASYPTAMAR